jgi:hypothetical protein
MSIICQTNRRAIDSCAIAASWRGHHREPRLSRRKPSREERDGSRPNRPRRANRSLGDRDPRGTLVDSRALILECHRAVFAEFRLPLPRPGDSLALIGRSLELVLSQLANREHQ